MRSLALFAFAGNLLSTIFAASAAASCVEPNFADQAARADVIAYGTVMRPIGLPFLPPARQVRFRVERVLKGTAQSEMDVAIGPGGSAATNVDYQAEDGTAHTLYLRRTGDAYTTDACRGSHPGSPTDQETALLGGAEFRVVDGHPPPMNWELPVAVGFLALSAGALLFWVRRRRVLAPRAE